MAEFIMKATVREAGLTSAIQIDSAAVSREEIGNPIYPPAQRQLRAHGVPFDDHRARQMTRADYDTYDLLIGMDGSNLAYLRRRSRWEAPAADGIYRHGARCRRPMVHRRF